MSKPKKTPSKSTKTKKKKKGAAAEVKAAKPKGAARSAEPAEIIAAARAEAFTDPSPEAAFGHFRGVAAEVSVEDLPVFTGQPLLMRANVLAALQAVEPHLEVAVRALREPRLQEIFELPALVMALDFAARRVPVSTLSRKEIEAMLTEGSPWRDLMLRFLEVASHPLLDLLPRERVAAVRAGTGKLDMAQDFVALPGLFNEFAEGLAGKHPFPGEALGRLAELGGVLVQRVRPGQANPVKVARPEEAVLRDRFAWVVAERYDQLGVVATVALGKRKADALLPALRSSVGGVRGDGDEETAEAAVESEAAASS